MSPHAAQILLLASLTLGCGKLHPTGTNPSVAANAAEPAPAPITHPTIAAETSSLGFDRNDYPGDDRLPELHRHFAFTGFWLNNPPGATRNTWQGKRSILVQNGFGFLVLFNGRLDSEIQKAQLTHTNAAALGKQDAAQAVAAAQRESFPPQTILFLDQEEGGRLLPEQSAYFFAFTEAIAASPYRPGAYLSGQPSPDGTGPTGKPATITTAADVQQHIASAHLHPVALWVAQDACPPSPGCTLAAPSLSASGTPGIIAWQYAQTPRRPQLTQSCAHTYAPDNTCTAGLSTDLFLDLNVAASPDPSHGR